MSSVEQAGPCFTSNQLDYDEEVTYQAQKYIWKRARLHRNQPWCLTVSMTHPHGEWSFLREQSLRAAYSPCSPDPYTARQEYWDRYEGKDIPMPKLYIPQDKQDPHSKRLLTVTDHLGHEMKEEDIKRARRAYFANCSYVDDKVGMLVEALRKSDLLDNTIIVFSGDHGDYLGERGLWYKMGYHVGAHDSDKDGVRLLNACCISSTGGPSSSAYDLQLSQAVDPQTCEASCVHDGHHAHLCQHPWR